MPTELEERIQVYKSNGATNENKSKEKLKIILRQQEE
jgi:hypothetical protein